MGSGYPAGGWLNGACRWVLRAALASLLLSGCQTGELGTPQVPEGEPEPRVKGAFRDGGLGAGDDAARPAPACGNGLLEASELCDGNCPSSCDDGAACTADAMTGTAGTCDADCTHTAITRCVDDDGCCAAGCDHTNDSDCSATCGNDVVDIGETCDGDCPSTCDDMNACTTDARLGAEATCNVECSHAAVSACLDGDGCCAPGCDSTNDDDCEVECGNGVVEDGEECDALSLPTAECNASCQNVCVWVIEYETDSQVEITDAESDEANQVFDQDVAGTIILQFTDDGGAPGDGPVGMLYSRSPTKMSFAVVGTTIATDVVVSAGTEDNACPITTGSLSGTKVTWDACPYMTDDWGKTAFDPGDQQVPSGMNAGCVRAQSVGNVECSGGALPGYVCGQAGLSEGSNPQDDTWDQPVGETVLDSTGFADGAESSVSFGGTDYLGSPYYPDDREPDAPAQAKTMTESPTNTASRLWRKAWSVKEISRACVPAPSCP